MTGQLQDKVVIVTGAGSGLGQAAATAVAQQGGKVVVAEINPDSGRQTVAAIEQAGGQATFIKTDIAHGEQVQAMVKHTLQTYGRLDCAYNNAGVDNLHAPLGEFDVNEWDRVLGVNLRGTMLCMRYEIPAMLDNGGGAIVNCASVAGLIGTPISPAYTTSKHAVVGLTRSAALDYAMKNIRVNAICPGVVHTPLADAYIKEHPDAEAQVNAQSPMGRMGKPSEIAAAVVWLCSDASSYVNGAALAVDGGWTAGTAAVDDQSTT